VTEQIWRGSEATLFTPHPALGSRALAARSPAKPRIPVSFDVTTRHDLRR
jgi:hypothetical protein